MLKWPKQEKKQIQAQTRGQDQTNQYQKYFI